MNDPTNNVTKAGPKNDKELAAELLAKAKERAAARALKRAETEKRQAALKQLREARKAAGEKVKTDAEKVADFKRLAQPRTNKAIKAIRQLAPLSARGSYAYDDKQVAGIRAALVKAIDETMAQFSKGGTAVEEFTL